MSTNASTVEFIVAQMSGAGDISARAMFGEYGVYCGGKIVALICQDQLFVKPTRAGRAFIGTPDEQPPYRGAKPSFLISADGLEDGDWLAELIRISADELPMPKAKKVKK
jgi:TfoX/Sxy family transcriptional regulator of competence genes